MPWLIVRSLLPGRPQYSSEPVFSAEYLLWSPVLHRVPSQLPSHSALHLYRCAVPSLETRELRWWSTAETVEIRTASRLLGTTQAKTDFKSMRWFSEVCFCTLRSNLSIVIYSEFSANKFSSVKVLESVVKNSSYISKLLDQISISPHTLG